MPATRSDDPPSGGSTRARPPASRGDRGPHAARRAPRRPRPRDATPDHARQRDGPDRARLTDHVRKLQLHLTLAPNAELTTLVEELLAPASVVARRPGASYRIAVRDTATACLPVHPGPP